VRALVIAPQPFFSVRGTPLSVYHRTAITAELGIEVDLLTYGEGEDPLLPGVRVLRIPRFRFLGDARVGPSYLKLFLDQFILLWTVALLFRHRYDFVHAHEEAAFFCRFLKPIFGFKLVYDMHSSLPEQLINFRFTAARPVLRFVRWLERSTLHAADAVITICPALAEYARGLGVEPDKHILIENSVLDPVRLATERQAPVEGDSVATLEHLDALPCETPLLVYSGTLEPYQGIDLLLAAFQQLGARASDVSLLVIGGSPAQVERYSSLAKSLDIGPRCSFVGRLPQETTRSYCRRATLLMSPRTVGSNTPLKIYEQIASGIPIVATRISAHTQVLDDRVAFLADPNPESFAETLASALHDPQMRSRKSAAARQLFADRYSRKAYVAKMVRLIEGLA
jgi:glycosyltransferase involved in cell wall biosynthesis